MVSNDCVDFMINEQCRFSKAWYFHKFNGPGLRYEVGICIPTGLIVWIYGPCVCRVWSDITTFCHHMINGLLPWELVEADSSYRGQPNAIHHKKEANISGWQYTCKSRVRAQHEMINSWLKRFRILSETFRDDICLYGPVFGAVALITQLGLLESPAFSIHYPAPDSFYMVSPDTY